MIDRQHGKIVFECDACGETLETGTGDFQEANTKRKDEGWQIDKVGNDWLHFCSAKCRRAK